ncbi:hypothetical protein F4777DRAFT_382654 [Nemania sp. FL0916]|nr:hypothetical protein F4777DRAFT_382654 [Nemania sp. FL0916]
MSSTTQPFGSNNPFRRKLGATPADLAEAASPTTSSSATGATASFDVDGTSDLPDVSDLPTFPTFPTSPASSPPPAATTRLPFTTFRSALPEDERRDEDEQPVQQKPKKIVKRVRVQSPPPSSPEPEDAVPVARFPAPDQLDSDDSDDDTTSTSSGSDNEVQNSLTTPSVDPDSQLASEPPLPQIPPNPFAKTLQDIEGTGQTQAGNPTAGATSSSKGSLDVDSFKRLLLTGYANLPNPPPAAQPSAPPHNPGTVPDGASATDGSSISKQSILDALQETPRTSHEISESETSEDRKGVLPSSPLAAIPSASTRKKPTPPSSKHGKLIRIDLGADPSSRGAKPAASSAASGLSSTSGASLRKASSESATSTHSLREATNVNKPLPAPPLPASTEDDTDSPFDREAAGKVPEAFADSQTDQGSPTPLPAGRSRSGSQTSTQSRKPAAPPPRRHGRADSKVPFMHSSNVEDDSLRSSMESNRSRTDSLRISVNSERHSHAPAPPPPRRPGHARKGSSFTSMNYANYASAAAPGVNENERSPLGSGLISASPSNIPEPSQSVSPATAGLTKISPPPPPPTRKQSTRRPPSVRSMELGNGPALIRRVSRDKDGGAPPPPPPRPRTWGASRPNPDSSSLNGEEVQAEADCNPATPKAAGSGKQGEEILADLNALQREVDEMMKKAAT